MKAPSGVEVYVGKGGTKSIFIDISAYKAHINSILMSKNTFCEVHKFNGGNSKFVS